MKVPRRRNEVINMEVEDAIFLFWGIYNQIRFNCDLGNRVSNVCVCLLVNPLVFLSLYVFFK